MKKFISIVLAVLMAFSAVSITVSADEAATPETPAACTHKLADGSWAGERVITLDATCTEKGVILLECTLCGQDVTTLFGPREHAYGEEKVVEPTCGSEGYTSQTCANCGDVKKDNIKPAKEHAYGDWAETLAPTCTADGTKQRICTLCDETVEGHALTETIPALGHDYKVTVVAPTYTEKGYTLHECTRCDDKYQDTPTDILKGKLKGIELGSKIMAKYNQVTVIKPELDMDGTVKVTYVFTSSSEGVATIDNEGNLTGKGMGTTTITCTATDEYGNTATDTVDVQVNFSFMDWIQLIIGLLKSAIDIVIGGLDFSSLGQLFK